MEEFSQLGTIYRKDKYRQEDRRRGSVRLLYIVRLSSFYSAWSESLGLSFAGRVRRKCAEKICRCVWISSNARTALLHPYHFPDLSRLHILALKILRVQMPTRRFLHSQQDREMERSSQLGTHIEMIYTFEKVKGYILDIYFKMSVSRLFYGAWSDSF